MKSSTSILKIPWLLLVVLIAPLVAQVGSDLSRNAGFTRHDRAFYLDQNFVNFIRPGIKVDRKSVV